MGGQGNGDELIEAGVAAGVQAVRELYTRMSAQEILDYATDFEVWASHPQLTVHAPGLRLAASALRFAVGNSSTFGVPDNAGPDGDPPVS